MNGLILDFEHFAIHDGPGVRLVVFLKGCPLRCIWCHTPESQSGKTELVYQQEHCLHCGGCGNLFEKIPLNDLTLNDLQAVENCPCGALTAAGKLISAEAVIAEAVKERKFFEESGGGLTVSGGEVLFQKQFTLELLRLAKANDISCCIETCGFGKFSDLADFLPLTEVFLYDFKATGAQTHKQLTGVDNTLIVENLQRLSDANARIHLRCPLIPTVNDSDEHLLNIAATAEKLDGIEEVHVIPYHPMARGKYQALGRKCAKLPQDFPAQEVVDYYVKTIAAHTGKKVLVP